MQSFLAASSVQSFLDSPAGWERGEGRGPRPFVTRERFRSVEREVLWESRRHRKRSAGGRLERGWWSPRTRNRWMAGGFAVGSLCFAAGGLASQFTRAGADATAAIFFAGSVFFTFAAYLQYAEAVNADRLPHPHALPRRWRPASWEPKRIDWLATLIQLIGTILFNISTFSALDTRLSTAQTDLRVWAPDIFGSVAFLLSSQLAHAEVCHRWLCLRPRGISWWIVALNLVGSLAFGVSALASLVTPGQATPVSAQLSDAGTWFGALCFLGGAVLLVPESSDHRP